MQIAPPQPSRSPWPAALLAAVVLVAALPAQAQWQWRDKNGQITASDLPPPRDVPDKDILKRPNTNAGKAPAPAPTAASAPAAAPEAPARPAGDKELEARKRAAEQEQQAKAQADEKALAKQRAENCSRARAHVASLDSGQRIARSNAKGELEILDDAGRAEEKRRANEVIASDCK